MFRFFCDDRHGVACLRLVASSWSLLVALMIAAIAMTAMIAVIGVAPAVAFEVVEVAIGPTGGMLEVAEEIPVAAGHGFVNTRSEGPCLSEAQRQAIRAELREARAELVARGILPAEPNRARLAVMEWPVVVPADHVNDPGVHGISGFVDHDPSFPDQLAEQSAAKLFQ
jgi:hypothetical protein